MQVYITFMAVYIVFIILTVGFFYNTLSPSSKFRMRNSSTWESYYYAGAKGVVLSVYGLIINVLLYYSFPFLFSFSHDDHIDSFIPFEFEYVNKTVFIMMWSWFSMAIAAILGNRSRKNGQNNLKALESMIVSDPFKYKIYLAVKNNDLLQITLKNRKIYIGMIMDFNLEDADPNKKYISLCPMFSGYRDEHDLSLQINNNYSDFYMNELSNDNSPYLCQSKVEGKIYSLFEKLKDKLRFFNAEPTPESSFSIILKTFSIVVPIEEIVHLGSFDVDAYTRINNKNE